MCIGAPLKVRLAAGPDQSLGFGAIVRSYITWYARNSFIAQVARSVVAGKGVIFGSIKKAPKNISKISHDIFLALRSELLGIIDNIKGD